MHKVRRVCLPLALIVMVSALAMAQIDGPAVFGRTMVGFSWGDQGLVPESSVAIDRAVWENLSEPVLFVADGNGPWNPGVVGVDQGAGGMRIGRLDGNPLRTLGNSAGISRHLARWTNRRADQPN